MMFSEILRICEEKGINLSFSNTFDQSVKKLKDNNTKIKLLKQILKIVLNPELGKYMKYTRKNLQEVYLDSFRLYYNFKNNCLRFTEFSHKKRQ